MEEMLGIIGNVGFPIAVAVYLLVRIENKLNSLTEAIIQLREAIILLPREKDNFPAV
ncbi:YvrJ family protein [Thermosyntropha sp.]|uniref:YvrJ family protein n=1 Tax=Thermosyntropha sp. TaxID=2740820 RepID=UPI0025EE9DD8|nr:YvrJ family protein [Thermosyntropha sp.]MBO8159068.1 YvrJ family protein [Thermosyntropha sp.]